MKNPTQLMVSLIKKSSPCILLMLVIILNACHKDKTGPQPEPSNITITKVAIAPENNDEKILEDGEALSVFTAENRRIDFSRLIKANAIDNTTIEITNFVPVDIADATILLKIKGRERPVKLLIADIKANTIKKIKYPFISGTTDYIGWETEKTVSLTQYKTVGIAPADVSFDYTGTTPLLQKLKKAGEVKWLFKPHDFDPGHTNPNWKDDPIAQDFRKYTAILINTAYLYSSATILRNEFLKEPITNNDAVLMTTEQKLKAYNDIINQTTMNLGITSGGVSGLGAGSTLGIGPGVINNSMFKPTSTFAHEMGHAVGFSHASSMTYPQDNKGSVPVCERIWKTIIDDGSFPIHPENYFTAGDFVKK